MRREAVRSRRQFLGSAGCAIVGGSSGRCEAQEALQLSPPRLPLKIGIRVASMQMVGQLAAIRAAAGIPGIMGVELQSRAGRDNLRDWDTVREYKREASRWAMYIPSIAGVWDPGVNLGSKGAADSLLKSIRAAELLGASVVLVAFFGQQAPDMNRPESYEPVVALLRRVARHAANAGVLLGLENSLSPADNRRLVELVDHPAVRVYYDAWNMAYYGHGAEAISGIKLLGKELICMVHVKNGRRLLAEPGPIDWAAALGAFNEIGYDGWYMYETTHRNFADCVADTQRNNEFLRRHVRMPEA